MTGQVCTGMTGTSATLSGHKNLIMAEGNNLCGELLFNSVDKGEATGVAFHPTVLLAIVPIAAQTSYLGVALSPVQALSCCVPRSPLAHCYHISEAHVSTCAST